MSAHDEPVPAEVTASMAAVFDTDEVRRDATVSLQWRIDEPAAMTLRISVSADDGLPAEEHEWVFARAVLVDAVVLGEAGDGDVSVSAPSCEEWVTFELRSGPMPRTCLLDYATVDDVLTQADALVPNESEQEDALIATAAERVLRELLW